MRSCTSSPITLGQAVMPKSLRLSVAVAEKPAVRRNGGSGCRLSWLKATSMQASRVTPRRVRSPQTRAWVASFGSIRLDAKLAVGWSPASSRFDASTALVHFASPMSTRSSGTTTSSFALLQSSGSNHSSPWLPDTVPSACEKPAWLTANSTRVCTGSKV